MQTDAEVLAESVIGHLKDRWRHVREVAATAVRVCETLKDMNPSTPMRNVVQSAWLHDIGYGVVEETGFHPLDGARLLRRLGISEGIVSLVAYHSSAEYEAAERGLLETLTTEFARPHAASLAILTYCDMHVGPQGEWVSFDARLADIGDRYGSDHLVTRSIMRSAPEMRSRIEEVENWLSAANPSTADRV